MAKATFPNMEPIMTAYPKLTEAAIRRLSTHQSFARAMDYYRADAVCELQGRGNALLAEVEGNSYEPYQITIFQVNWPNLSLLKSR